MLIAFQLIPLADIKNLNDEFKNKKVLITGATGGIGHSLVKKFNEFRCKYFSNRY